MEAPEEMFVNAQSNNTQGCNTSGTVVGVPVSCSPNKPELCCDGVTCIEQSLFNNRYQNCFDGSDETRPPFSQCAAEREASPIETRGVVIVQCKPLCTYSPWKAHCQKVTGKVTLTEVPTFVNKDVMEM